MPVALGRCTLAPRTEFKFDCDTATGKPLCMVVWKFTFHPPTSRSSTRLLWSMARPLPNGRAQFTAEVQRHGVLISARPHSAARL
ncbi:MAG: hypothetical protein ACLQVN_25360 [Bryobacteraceae bacterium]